MGRVHSARRLRVLRTRLSELEGVGLTDGPDRLSARRGPRALRPVPCRRRRRQRRHLHRPLRTARPHAGVFPHRRGRRWPHRNRGVGCVDAGAREGQGHRADQWVALQRQQSRGAAVDPHHRLALGVEVLRAVRTGATVEGRGVPVLGRVADRRRTADLQAGRRACVARRGSAVLRRRARQPVHLRACRSGDELPALDATRPRSPAVGGQPDHGTRGDRDSSEMDAPHGQFRSARRRRRGRCPSGAGNGPGTLDRQLPSDAGHGASAGSAHRGSLVPAPDRGLRLRYRRRSRLPRLGSDSPPTPDRKRVRP